MFHNVTHKQSQAPDRLQFLDAKSKPFLPLIPEIVLLWKEYKYANICRSKN